MSKAAHSQGNLQLTIDEPGAFGVWSENLVTLRAKVDPLNGDSVYGCIYPRGSGHRYLQASLCLGAVVDGDSLVSSDYEMAPVETQEGSFSVLAGSIMSEHYSPQARSQLDLLCEYVDWGADPLQMLGWDIRPHIPLRVRINQRSMSWSGATVDDFVLLEFRITNEGQNDLTGVFVGFGFEAISHDLANLEFDSDNLVGLLRTNDQRDACRLVDTLNVAYVMDNDGDPQHERFDNHSPRAAVGVMLLGASEEVGVLNFNWWTGINNLQESFGPRRRATVDDRFHSVGPFLGQPYKDANLYYVMAHPEVDYDEMFTALDHSADGWLSPPAAIVSEAVASGMYGQCLLSFGPFDLPRREKISFTIAVVGGDNVHNDPTIKFNPQNPQYYYDQLDFSELAENARWAQWVYDNPGVDTDSDGYAGEFRVCEGDTTWYKGDGVPDFRGNSPPPIPFTRYETDPGRIIVRWNGFLSETTKDIFSGLIDFEGYRVYCGLDNRRTSLSLLSSYDKENWFRLKYHQLGVGNSRWINDDPPYSLDSLRIVHHDPDLNPDRY
ncbi:MAG: hypothetical protein NTW07_09535, partial [candidate division Zixibacteria bacterium]|nr:hypothetical protein [candidate division Zixibacteria bacterium]